MDVATAPGSTDRLGRGTELPLTGSTLVKPTRETLGSPGRPSRTSDRVTTVTKVLCVVVIDPTTVTVLVEMFIVGQVVDTCFLFVFVFVFVSSFQPPATKR